MATYDHHCPWVGNCIAERNRKFFFYFLLLQVVEDVMAFWDLLPVFINDSNEPWLQTNWVTLLASLICVFFFFMVGSLAVMHIYLALSNLTTWEYLSWQKISYMKVWPKKYGSPFSKGSRIANFHMYLFPEKYTRTANGAKKRHIQWEMPTAFPVSMQKKASERP